MNRTLNNSIKNAIEATNNLAEALGKAHPIPDYEMLQMCTEALEKSHSTFAGIAFGEININLTPADIRAFFPLVEAVSHAHLAYNNWASQARSAPPSGPIGERLNDLASIVHTQTSMKIILCYSGAVALCILDLKLLEKACSNRGDYFRLFSGFMFAYDWWQADWGYGAYKNAKEDLNRSSQGLYAASLLNDPDLISSLIHELSTVATALLASAFNTIDMSPKARQEMATVERTALNRTKILAFMLNFSEFVARTAESGEGHGIPPPSPRTLLCYLSVMTSIVSHDTVFNYAGMDVQKGYSAKVTLAVLHRLDEFLTIRIIPCQICALSSMMMDLRRENSVTLGILTTPKALKLLASGAKKLLEESTKESYSVSEKAALAAAATSMLSLRVGASCVAVTKLQRQLPISLPAVLASATEQVDAWQQVVQHCSRLKKTMDATYRNEIFFAASVFDASSNMLTGLLASCTFMGQQSTVQLVNFNMDDSDIAVGLMSLMSHAAISHVETVRVLPGQAKWTGGAKILESGAVGLIDLIRIIEAMFRLHQAARLNPQYQARGPMFGHKAGEMWDAAWKATLACSEQCLVLSKVPEKALKDMHRPTPEFVSPFDDKFAEPVLAPPQTALAVLLCTSAAADAIELDEHRSEREIAALLKVLHAVGLCPDYWRKELARSKPNPIAGISTLALGKGPLLHQYLIPADVAGLEMGLKFINILEGVVRNKAPNADYMLSKEGVHNLITYAQGADPKDTTRAIARAQALQHLPCSYLGCTALWPLTGGDNHKEVKSKVKKCSGCVVVRYCSPDCQNADWKLHKVACKAIAAAADGQK